MYIYCCIFWVEIVTLSIQCVTLTFMLHVATIFSCLCSDDRSATLTTPPLSPCRRTHTHSHARTHTHARRHTPHSVGLCARFATAVCCLLACVHPSCAVGSKQHLFRGCCSSWLLFNWISSCRAKSCHLCQALLAITAGPYIK